ncbi:MAG: tetratricopeptide repeat protein [Candidatus Margulisbacteria bacterium]|nr:tetratricopeptide repeat protein [Candidatus Margulisiibacteriota bacterium]MBU1021325.1 tetratricopeptide repeat protein [Candidatus Margulisiibacteriota bacterium]MBU1729186.1 tetratricopeptide repeat protein [Candidatus Margulisiibacteriota bacterium]MBU1954859.1 tetratricopeptide repeat protein [Candidatus Margulisiibacteriota bacterium]
MAINVDKIKKTLKENPNDADSLRFLGFALLLKGRYRSAKEKYRLAVLYNPHLKTKIVLDYEKMMGNNGDGVALRLSLAEFYLSIGESNSAVLEFEEALDLDPENVSIYNALGKIYITREEIDNAIALLEKSLRQGVKDLPLTEMLAGAYLEKKRYQEAIALYQEVLSYDPSNKKILRTLGELNARMSRFDQAADCFAKMFSDDPEVAREVTLRLEELSSKAPTSVRIKELLADIYFRSMQPDKSVAMYEKILNLDAAQADAAVANCRKILKSYPVHPAAIISLASFLSVKQEYSEAAAEYFRLSKLKPEYLEQAIAGYKKIIKDCPNQVLAHQYLADAYLKQDRLNEAVLEYEAALSLTPEIAPEVISKCKDILKSRPNFLLGHRVLGEAYIVTGDLRQAVSKAEEIISIDKKYAAGHAILGEAYAGLKLSRKASAALHTALTLDPYNKGIHEKFKKMREKELALEVESNLTKLKEDPWKVSLHLDLGKLYLALDNNEKAIEELQLSLKDRVRAPFAYNLLGSCYRTDGRFDLAQKNFEKALEIVTPELHEFKKVLMLNLGITYEARGQLMKAVSAYEEVLAEDTNFGDLKNRIKVLKSSKIAALRSKKIICVLKDMDSQALVGLWGRDGQMSEKMSKSEAVNMSFGQNHNTDGFELFNNGMYGAAKEEFMLSTSLDSSFSPGLNNLAAMHLMEGAFEESQSNLEAAIDEDFESPVFYNNLGVLYYLKGNVGEAIKILEKAKQMDASLSAVKINLGTLWYRSGEVEKAIKLFKEITEDDVLSDIAKRRLMYKVP